MPDALHLFWPNLGGADVHMPVHLHGIRGDDLSIYGLCKRYGKFCFAGCRRAGQYDQRIHLVSSFCIRYRFRYFNCT